MIMTVSSAKCAQRRPFLETLRLLATNLPFLIIFLFLGGAMGYISTLQTKLEQVLCSRGYSDSLAGLAAALIIISGFLASFPLGYAALRSGKLVLVSKAACVPAVAVLAASVWVFGQAGRGELVVAACVVLGVCSLGIYPVMLELSVEATWPLDESVVTGLCYLSSAIQVTLVKHTECLKKNVVSWKNSQLPSNSSKMQTLGVYWKIQDILYHMGTEIYKIEEEITEKTKPKVANPSSKNWQNSLLSIYID